MLSSSRFERGIDRVAAEAALREGVQPAAARMTLLARIHASPACYRGDMTDAELDEAIRRTGLLPPTQHPGGNDLRFLPDTTVWLGNGLQGNAGTSRRANLTYSFVPDGTQWGLFECSGYNSAPSALDASLTTAFGLERGRELMRSSLAAWRRVAGLTYTEVADDGSPMDLLIARSPMRGDIRIGGIPLGTGSNPLAYNAFPSAAGFTSCSGSDMVINTSFFNFSNFRNVFGNFLYFRNTVAHEHGHGLGLRHVVPCTATKLMEPTINTVVNLLTSDEIRGAISNYGDRFAGNNSFATARDFGNLAPSSGPARSVIERDLGLNGTGVLTPGFVTEDDYFTFTLSTPQTVTITTTPTGVAGDQGGQSSGCNGSTTFVDGTQAGDLAFQLYNSAQGSIRNVNAQPFGNAETTTIALAAGQYFLRVYDTGTAPTANQRVQTYDLTLRVGSALAPPTAIAGLNKRVRVNTQTLFIGDHNSRANEPGATLSVSGYSWDLDGDGTFEVVGDAQPTRTYTAAGTYTVTLRVTDSNGQSATDSIVVTVFGATVASVTPSNGLRATTVPITIAGTNLTGVTTLGQLSISGTGVALAGTPAPSGGGTSVTGVSLVIQAGASLGARDITITNADGQGTTAIGTQVFEVLAGTGSCCLTDGTCTPGQTSVQCTSAGGTYQGDGSGCPVNQCPQPTGACCLVSGSCLSAQTQSQCASAGGIYQGNVSSCASIQCPQPTPTGACCLPSNTCVSAQTLAQCMSAGGSYRGDGVTCLQTNCNPPTGACCAGATCSLTTAAACTGTFRRFAGANVACNVQGNQRTPCCKADYNQSSASASGGLTVQDIFDFLAGWFAKSVLTDVNSSGVVDVTDIFDFLNAWFSGCP